MQSGEFRIPGVPGPHPIPSHPSQVEAPHVGGVVAHLAQHPVLAHAGLIGLTARQLAHHDGHAVHVAGHAQGPWTAMEPRVMVICGARCGWGKIWDLVWKNWWGKKVGGTSLFKVYLRSGTAVLCEENN